MGKARNVLIALLSHGRTRLNREIAVYALLIIVALVMRLWDVGARAFH